MNSYARQFQLLQKLGQEAGVNHLLRLSLLSTTNSLIDVAGLGLAVTLLLGSRAEAAPQPMLINLPLSAVLGLLIGIVLLRGQLQALVAINQERLRSEFADRLRQQLFHQVFTASSNQLNKLGRGDLLGLLMGDISRTVQSLDQAVLLLQGYVSLAIYLFGVLLVGQTATLPLLLASMSIIIMARTLLRLLVESSNAVHRR